MATYRIKAGPGEIGGVDGNGSPHDPIVSDDEGLFSIPDAMQECAQTLAHALAAGTIERATQPKRRKES